jgi:hypothetical protein
MSVWALFSQRTWNGFQKKELYEKSITVRNRTKIYENELSEMIAIVMCNFAIDSYSLKDRTLPGLKYMSR